MKNLICIICPRGCHLNIDEQNKVSGNFCPRGEKYALEEITCPKRTITSTVRTNGLINCLCPIKSSSPLPKEIMFKVMDEINKIKIDLPIHIGDIIIKNVCNSGVNIIATKNIEKEVFIKNGRQN